MADRDGIGLCQAMPKSRKRRPRRSTTKRRTTSARGRRPRDPRAELAELEPWLATTFAADDAEARGDAEAALAILSERPFGPDGRPFWRPWRVRYLTQLAGLGPLLPRWATSRWILAQALQSLHEESRDKARRALELAIELRGGESELPGLDDMDAKCKVMDHDWVYRQVFLYELGGLHDFLRRRASPDLVAGADRIREWARAPMGAYRLLDRAADVTTWEDLATGAEIGLANIGSGALVVPEEERVIGRLVPVEGGSMFEAAPLVVTRGVAEQVAEDPVGWVDSLRAARDEVVGGEILKRGDHSGSGLLSDVPAVIWQYAVLDGRPIPPASALTSVTAKGILELARVQLVTPFDDDPSDLDAWACLSAGLLEPGVSLALLEVMQPGDRGLLLQLAERLADPAAAVCSRLAESLGQAA
jgi:hypothetical protein